MTARTPDVLVLGAGAAGLAAAVAAARSGARVTLVERYGFTGGLATTALVGTVCGLFHRRDDGPAWAVSGFPRAFAERLAELGGTAPSGWRDGLWFLPYDALALRRLGDQLCEEHGVEPLLHATVADVVRDGRRVDEVRALAWDRRVTFRPGAVVDATGTATVAELAGAAVLDDLDHQAPAYVVGVVGLPELPDETLRLVLLRELMRAARAGRLPADAESLSLVPGTRRGDRAGLKLGLRGRTRGDPEEVTALERRARAEMGAIVAFLREEVDAFEKLQVVEAAAQLGVRTGRRARGLATLEEADVLSGRKPADGVAVGAWPLEIWGNLSRPELTLAPEGTTYHVPAGCLRVAGVDGLFVAGRAISATERAVASARVIGTCLGTGYAAGRLAAAHALGRSADEAIAAVREEQVCPR